MSDGLACERAAVANVASETAVTGHEVSNAPMRTCLTSLVTIPCADWHANPSSEEWAFATDALESGNVLVFPKLSFALDADERRFLSPEWSDGKAKNISFDAIAGTLKGARGSAADQSALAGMIARFADQANALITGMFPLYLQAVVVKRTSFRPVAADDRETSRRKDDRLLHVDAFPSQPNRGARILRVFTNINPAGQARVWRVGELFEDLAARFLPNIPAPLPGAAHALSTMHITKGIRSRYDHMMLHLHDLMKTDDAYQRDAPQELAEFAPGCTWVCFSDQVSHAVLGGQYMLEQTLELPVTAMAHPDCAPLRVLERLSGRALV